jgi:GNAT superfamily N-acetyltransferase
MSGEVTLRPARADEQRALEALQRRASLAWEEYREALLAHPEAIELPIDQIAGGRVVVAARDGETIGFAVGLKRPDGDGELDGLFVEPDKWRGGVGRKLVDAIALMSRREGARALHVIANPRALGFYERCDFAAYGEEETQFGPGIRMRKAL